MTALTSSSVPTGWSARLRAGSRASVCSSVGGSSSERATNRTPSGHRACLRDARRDPVADRVLGGARLEAVGKPDSIDAWPNSSPSPSRSSTRPSGRSRPRRAGRLAGGDRPLALHEDRRSGGRYSSSASPATRTTSSLPSSENGGQARRNAATSSASSALTAPASSVRGRGLRARVLLDHVRAFLADHHRRDTGVDRRQERKNRAVGDPQSATARTRRRGSTTAIGSESGPIFAVQAG